MKYDDASWHYEGDYPSELPNEAGATHIGMFLAWALSRNLSGTLHLEESKAALDKLRNRDITGAAFLIEQCDEKLTDEDLNDVGNAFAAEYYENTYFDDYCVVFKEGETAYHVENTWANFDRIAPVLDRRFEQWQSRRR
jgi:hypothetical protein